ncbi:hypothetical protein HYW76_03455 [Candidatus Pacearchaeota archaeon]|nr:hypothetical protein [Candidatus Pacearchaeota archaeon]
MKKTNNTSILKLCSRCAFNEMSLWINDKSGEIKPEITQRIMQEIKSIKLVPGECIVCRHNIVSSDCFESILKILEKNRVSSELILEFKHVFGFM